jgi:betaine-aldehyde dehydrogenase
MSTLNLIVSGQETKSRNDEYLEVRNPADVPTVVGRVPNGTREDARAAIDAAEETFNKNKQWSSIYESRYRGSLLWKIALVIDQNKSKLARTLTLEQGKPLKEAEAEVAGCTNTFEYYAGYGGKIEGRLVHTKLGNKQTELKEILEPIGVCAAITPWNYPLLLLAWKMAPALIAGNTMVVKPSISTPLSTLEVVNLMKEAGLPNGVVNVVTGPSSEVGREIVSSSKVRKVAFTGSTETGKRILLEGAKQIKHITLELGGSDPTIVCDDADLDMAAENIVFLGRYRNCGQSCTSVKRLYVFQNVYEKFMNRVVSLTKSIRVGQGLDQNVQMGPLHTASQLESVESMVSEAVERGAGVLAGGHRLADPEYSKGYFYEPTLLSDTDQSSSIWRDECFGPALPVAPVTTVEEAVEKANSSNYGLGACVWTRSETQLKRFEEGINSGILWVNSAPISVPEASFGGVKDSGVGRELGLFGLLEYLEVKSIRRIIG